MITYINDQEFKYKEDILNHLRKYNSSITGEKQSIIKYYYALDGDKLVGSLKATLSWDWIGIGDLFYENTDVLRLMLSKVCKEFRNKVVGIKFFSEVKSRIDDFVDIGFDIKGYIDGTPKEKGYFFVDLLSLDITSDSNLDIISQEEKLEEYSEVIKEKTNEFNKKHDITNDSEDISVVALDKDNFVGGVHGDLCGDVLYISLLVVNEEYRGQDVGTNLMTKIENEAKQKGAVRLSLGTAEFQARNFYEKLGFKVVHTRKDFPKGYECYTLIKDI